MCKCLVPPSLTASFSSKFSPRSVGRTAYLAPPLVDNSRTPTLSSSSSTSCRPDTHAAITTMIQINPWVCLCFATLARERTGEAAAQGQNSGTGLLEVCVGGGAQTEGKGRPDGRLFSSGLNFWERKWIKCPYQGFYWGNRGRDYYPSFMKLWCRGNGM